MTNRDILDELRSNGELAERLKRLAPRVREIVNLRYGLSWDTGLIVRGEMTIEQTAKLYCVTNERIRQIEKKAFKSLSEGLPDSTWHTGTPTEEGQYFIAYRWGLDNQIMHDMAKQICYGATVFSHGTWMNVEFPFVVLAWQRITPYEEASE